MNKLNFKFNNENGLSIELLIDEKSINEIFPSEHYPFLPYWLFDDDLPYWPPNKKDVMDFSIRIIGVCECGEYGCGNLRTKIENKNNIIYWSHFQGRQVYKNLKFSFDEDQYNNKILEILKIIHDYRKRENIT